MRKSKGIQLSGGERRRCEIARALAVDPKFILLDEPFAGVDPIAVEDIQYIIAKLKYRNIGVIITDHNVGETLAITDRAYLLYEGVILQQGTPEELAADEDVRTKYLGSGFILKRSKSVERARAEVEAQARAEAEAKARAEAEAQARAEPEAARVEAEAAETAAASAGAAPAAATSAEAAETPATPAEPAAEPAAAISAEAAETPATPAGAATAPKAQGPETETAEP